MNTKNYKLIKKTAVKSFQSMNPHENCTVGL